MNVSKQAFISEALNKFISKVLSYCSLTGSRCSQPSITTGNKLSSMTSTVLKTSMSPQLSQSRP